MKKLLSAGAALLLLALPQTASAVCLFCSCEVSTTAVAFGTYDPLSASPHDSAGNVHVSCTTTLGLLVTLTISLDKGSYSSSFSPRKMASGANRLNYDLYTDAAHTIIWGDGSGGTQTVSDSLALSLLGAVTWDHAAYGRIPASQTTVPPGSYADTVIVTLTYN